MNEPRTYLLTDVQYALAQLRLCRKPGYCSSRGYDCATRAIDALERVEANLAAEEIEEANRGT